MDYIIILYPNTKQQSIYDDFFLSYKEAKEHADNLMIDYTIYVSCTDEKNYPM